MPTVQKAMTYSTGNVADLCGVSTNTVQNWIETGELKASKLPSSNWSRIYPEVLVAFMKKHGFRVPKEVQEQIVEQTK